MGLAVAIGCQIDNDIYVTDQENMLELMDKNIELNGLEAHVKALVLNWWVLPPFPEPLLMLPI